MAHPPLPGGIVQPNFLAIEEALGNVTFPISKRDLLDQIDGGTALLGGRNVDLRELVRELRDDYFESEEVFRDCLEERFATLEGEASPGALPTGPEDSPQAEAGPGNSGGRDAYFEPGE